MLLLKLALYCVTAKNTVFLFTIEILFCFPKNKRDIVLHYMLQPDGIMEIAAKKGKVYGDLHDSHRWTQEQLNELQVCYFYLFVLG